jgi:ATP-dependent Clp protease ATP-binding subunit ClpC
MNENSTTQPTILSAAKEFRAAIWLDNRFSAETRSKLLGASVGLGLVAAFTRLALEFYPTLALPAFVAPAASTTALVALAGALLLGALQSFYLYYRLSEPAEPASTPGYQLSYPAADVLLAANPADATTGLIASRFGRLVCLRAGINPDTLQAELRAAGPAASLSSVAESLDSAAVTLTALITALLAVDARLVPALFSRGISRETFQRAARWVEESDKRFRRQTRWWSAENLRQITPLGESFAYGEAYTLEQFSRPLQSQSVFLGVDSVSSAFSSDLEAVLRILTRPRAANALLVGRSSGGIGDILKTLKGKLWRESFPDLLVGHRLQVLDSEQLIQAAGSKARLEYLLEKLLVEATNAGNVLLVIERIDRFWAEAAKLGVDIWPLLEPFLEHSGLPIVATTPTDSYHRQFEGRSVMDYFGAVSVHNVSDETLRQLLSEVAERTEGSSVVTVGGIEALIQASRQIVTDTPMANAAVNLLLEITANTSAELINESVVNTYVTGATGVPTGAVSEAERATLSGIGAALHERIIGQDPAVMAIAAALRRNRSGVEPGDRPIGSFLFFGPTGVGKTETAKTLARVYFDDSEPRRLDMSEYSGQGALEELRGASGSAGRLATIVREQPYGVLLLDEFEKASQAVHDLFLRIFDEGEFTDGAGRLVSLDNLIIIATSNAGAAEIFRLVEAGDDLRERESDIIDGLIADNVFRPELLNRFDAVVLYQPLSGDDLLAVTNLLLADLVALIHERGYRLELADDVAPAIVERGYSPEFGARAIEREIQDTVENRIADKIIESGLQAGDTISLSAADIKTKSEN